MKFNEHIVFGKFTDGDEIIFYMGNMKYVSRNKRFTKGSINRTLTNMFDVQTYSVANLDGVVAVVALMKGEAIQVAGDMVRCACVRVMVRINLVPDASFDDICQVFLLVAME